MLRCVALRRAQALQRQLGRSAGGGGEMRLRVLRASSASAPVDDSVTIGDVTLPVRAPMRPELVPRGYDDPELESQEALQHLRWMMQKYALRQDMFLIGPPGALRRRLALRFAELLQLETEFVALTRDTTEADLKQRREIVRGSVFFVDQAPVAAATHGRLLIVEGIEKAERNLLPTLNNLLENREMALEDGRFLVSTARYDALLQRFPREQLESRKLVRVHPDFRVVALGLPVPRFPGYPLDPPLRSRFQARHIGPLSLHAKLDALAGAEAPALSRELRALGGVRETLRVVEAETARAGRRMPQLSDAGVDHVARVLALAPEQPLSPSLLARAFPFPLVCDAAQRASVEEILRRFIASAPAPEADAPAFVSARRTAPGVAEVVLRWAGRERRLVSAGGPRGEGVAEPPAHVFVRTPFHTATLAALLLDHAAGRDLCVVGAKGCGKSALVREFARLLGYAPRVVHLFREMTSRDLLQRRAADARGNTQWQRTPLVEAALAGELVVLDGLHQLPPATLAALRTLLEDRELVLFDGTRLTSAARYERLRAELSEDALRAAHVLPIPASFRVVALAQPPTPVANEWLTEETQTLFAFHHLGAAPTQHVAAVARALFPAAPQQLLAGVLELAAEIEALSVSHALVAAAPAAATGATAKPNAAPAPASASGTSPLSLSLRQLIRVLRRGVADPRDLRDAISRTLLSRFLPTPLRAALTAVLDRHPLTAASAAAPRVADAALRVERREKEGVLRIGDAELPLHATREPELVPHVLFFDISAHLRALSELMKDWAAGERHLLLIGNQGVGKNKLADRLLELLGREREYMQLHRDTTVQALTTTPSLVGGALVFEDSPLVRAVQHGRVLVVDEADKAPLEVVSVLKGLLEDGEMTLADGRRIVARAPEGGGGGGGERLIVMHPDFRVLVLANRVGWPFLGNDFFRECGDVFAVHAVDNPDAASELQLLRAYGPSVPEELLRKLVAVAGSLRAGVEEGLFAYPYSTREMVAITRHLQQFPSDGLLAALHNVLAFDAFDPALAENLQAVFHEHGVPLSLRDGAAAPRVELSRPVPLPQPQRAARLSASGVAGEAGAAPVAAEGAELRVREFHIDAGNVYAAEEWEQSRLARFSEERLRLRLRLQPGAAAAAVAALRDGSVHVLLSRPASVAMLHPRSAYRRFTLLQLDDFLPGYLVDAAALRMAPVLGGEELLVLAPAHGVGILARPPDEAAAAGGKVRVRVFPIFLNLVRGGPLARGGPAAFIEFLSPGFKMPFAWATHGPGGEGGRGGGGAWAVAEAWADEGTVLMWNAPLRSVVLLDLRVFRQTALNLSAEPVHVLPLGAAADGRLLVELADGSRLLLHVDAAEARLRGWQPVASSAPLSPHAASGRAADAALLLPRDAARSTHDASPLFRVARGPLLGASGRGEAEVLAVSGPVTQQPEAVQLLPEASRVLAGGAALAFASLAPRKGGGSGGGGSGKAPALSVVDVVANTLRVMAVSDEAAARGARELRDADGASPFCGMAELRGEGDLVTLQQDGTLRFWQLDAQALARELEMWRRMFGGALTEQRPLRLERASDARKEARNPKTGKVDPHNKPHVGGRQWRGGTGGADTAGLGGKGGPFREDAGHDVHQLSDQEKADVSEEAKKAAREIAQAELRKRLAEIDMSEAEDAAYARFATRVAREVVQLRLILQSVEAKAKEREWLRLQTQGDLDENRLVDGVVGERSVYRRRGEAAPQLGVPQRLPKRLHFLVDVSASMYRFNGYDQRLDRLLETTLLVMESLHGFEDKYSYAIVGHSGDGPEVPLVDYGRPPANRKERLKVLQRMHAHAQYCQSGDSTLAAVTVGQKRLLSQDADDHFLVLVSDANLRRYGIDPQDLGRALAADSRANAFAVFIASFEEDLAAITRRMPAGRAFVCRDIGALPHIFTSIFTSSIIRSA